MRKRSYSKALQHPRWQRKRLSVMERAGWRCEWCGNGDENLQVHHGFYSKGKDKRARHEYPEDSLWVLCESCHQRAELARYCLYIEIGKIHPRHHYELRRLLQEARNQLAEYDGALGELEVEVEGGKS